jgi:hypothetical protein
LNPDYFVHAGTYPRFLTKYGHQIQPSATHPIFGTNLQTFTPKFQPYFAVDRFDELAEMEIRSKKGRVADG